MIRFLYFTDTHIRATNPVSRLDDYCLSLQNKIAEINSIGNKFNVDFYVHGGDLFDRPDINVTTFRQFSKLLSNFKKPIFYVPGNHDIYGYNLDSINRTLISCLDDVGILTIMFGKYPIYFSKDNISIELWAAPYTYELDTDNDRKNYKIFNKKADFGFMFAHGMLLTKDGYEFNYTKVDDILDTEADLTVCGHYHTGFNLISKNGKHFINPGSIARLSASEDDYTRQIFALLVEISSKSELNIQKIKLESAKPGNEILDRNKILEKKSRDRLINSFYDFAVDDFKNTKNTILDYIDQISESNHYDEKVKKRAIEYLNEVSDE